MSAAPPSAPAVPRRALFIDIHEFHELETELNDGGQWSNRQYKYNFSEGRGTYFLSALRFFFRVDSQFGKAVRAAEDVSQQFFIVFPDGGAFRRFYRMAQKHLAGQGGPFPLANILYLTKVRVGTLSEQSDAFMYYTDDPLDPSAEPKSRPPTGQIFPHGARVLVVDDFTNSGSTLIGASKLIRRRASQDEGGVRVEAYVSHFVALYDRAKVRSFVDKLYDDRADGGLDMFSCSESVPTVVGWLRDECLRKEQRSDPQELQRLHVVGLAPLISDWLADEPKVPVQHHKVAAEAHDVAMATITEMRKSHCGHEWQAVGESLPAAAREKGANLSANTELVRRLGMGHTTFAKQDVDTLAEGSPFFGSQWTECRDRPAGAEALDADDHVRPWICKLKAALADVLLPSSSNLDDGPGGREASSSVVELSAAQLRDIDFPPYGTPGHLHATDALELRSDQWVVPVPVVARSYNDYLSVTLGEKVVYYQPRMSSVVWDARVWLKSVKELYRPLEDALLRPMAHERFQAAQSQLSREEMRIYDSTAHLHLLKNLDLQSFTYLLHDKEMARELASSVDREKRQLDDDDTTKQLNKKYAFELKFGTLEHFHSGLEKLVGSPPSNIFEAMVLEHCSMHDSTRVFQTTNYKKHFTTPKLEWLYVRDFDVALKWFRESSGSQEDWLKVHDLEDFDDAQPGATQREVTTYMDRQHTSHDLRQKIIDHVGERLRVNPAHRERLEAEWELPLPPEGKPDAVEDSHLRQVVREVSKNLAHEIEAFLADYSRAGGHRRVMRTLEQLEAVGRELNEELKKEGVELLEQVELIAANLYTGPMFVCYNAGLRSIMMNLPSSTEQAGPEQAAASRAPSRAAVPAVNMFTYEHRLPAHLPASPPWPVRVVVAAVARTVAVGAEDDAPLPSAPRSTLPPRRTTVHVINSTVVKLMKLTQAVPVYRGIMRGALPEEFTSKQSLLYRKYQVRGGVEIGFMSTTKNKQVAASYAGGNSDNYSILMEMSQGIVDRGADLSRLSQYPDEAEILCARARLSAHAASLLTPPLCSRRLSAHAANTTPHQLVVASHAPAVCAPVARSFPPLTALEMVGERIEKKMRVVEVRPKCNTESLTITQVVEKRDKMIHEMIYNMERT